jgi:uncharacterized damage-inducible protein DinB
MTKDDIQLLYEYDRWANNRVLQKASELSDEQFTRDLGGSFRSVRDTLVHIIGGEWRWLASWKEPSLSSAFLTDLRTQGTPCSIRVHFPTSPWCSQSGRKSRKIRPSS